MKAFLVFLMTSAVGIVNVFGHDYYERKWQMEDRIESYNKLISDYNEKVSIHNKVDEQRVQCLDKNHSLELELPDIPFSLAKRLEDLASVVESFRRYLILMPSPLPEKIAVDVITAHYAIKQIANRSLNSISSDQKTKVLKSFGYEAFEARIKKFEFEIGSKMPGTTPGLDPFIP